jgi:hypothetical protein
MVPEQQNGFGCVLSVIRPFGATTEEASGKSWMPDWLKSRLPGKAALAFH